MGFDDAKLIVLFLLLLGGGYYFLSKEFTSRKNWQTYSRPREEPTIKFVAPGTPGAKTWQEIQQEQADRRRVGY
jgi:hypothetical protein